MNPLHYRSQSSANSLKSLICSNFFLVVVVVIVVVLIVLLAHNTSMTTICSGRKIVVCVGPFMDCHREKQIADYNFYSKTCYRHYTSPKDPTVIIRLNQQEQHPNYSGSFQ